MAVKKEFRSDNDVSRIITFLNAQVGALWKKAFDYTTEKYARYIQHQNYRYMIALAKYSLGSQNDHPYGFTENQRFDIQLKAPRIGFICNHTAMVELNVIKAQYALDRPRLSHEPPVASRTDEEMSDIKVTFRMSFQMSDVMVEDKDKKPRPAKRFDLDYKHAKLVQISLPVSRGREAFEAYLQGYLSFLQTAGHATFFCPAAFSDENQPIPVDFSRASLTSPTGTGVQTVPVEEINRFLCTSWLMASTMPRSQPGKPVDRVALSLAEARSKVVLGGKDVHFGMVFGPPEVEVAAVCDDEAILYFDIAEALFYKTGEHQSHPFKVFCDWKVAVLMNIEREQTSDSNVIKYIVNPRGSHFMPQLSQLAGCLESDQEAVQCRDRIIEFICGEYLNILEKAGYLVILHHDLRWAETKHRPSDISDPTTISPSDSREAPATNATTSSSSVVPGPTTWQDLSQRVDMAGFDQVFALSETSINDRFQSHWARSQADVAGDRFLTEWHHDDHFSAIFGPLELQLTSERKAILRVKLVKGSLKPIRGRSFHSRNVDQFHFSDWSVAFSVDLDLCDHASLPGVDPEWRSDFARSHPLSSRRDVTFNHVYLDLQHAEFDLEHSSFKDLCTADDKRSIDKAQAAVVYLRDHYFKRLASTGRHILSTVPVWDASSHAFSRGLTSVSFYTNSERARFDASTSLANVSEPVVLVVGMNNSKTFPVPIPQRWDTWVSNNPSPSHGMLALSADSFLHASLLPILSEVNAMTRIEPTPSVVERSPWELYLTSWNNHSQRVVGDCAFVPSPSDGAGGPVRYHWKSSRKFTIGRDESRFGLSRTENCLELPTTSSPNGLKIALYGTVCLELVETGWRSVAYAHWRTVVKVLFEDCQPRVTTVTYPTEFTETESEGRPSSLRSFNPQEMLRRALPKTMDVGGLEQGLRPLVTVLQACRTGHPGCHFVDPVFNRKGDLLFRISAQPSSPAPTSDDLAVLPEPHGLNTHLRLKPSSPIPARGTYLQGIPAHKRISTAGVHSDDDSPDASPVSPIFSPTRGGAKQDFSHFRNLGIDDESEPNSPASSFSSSSASLKPDLSPPYPSISISPPDDSSILSRGSQTVRSSPMEASQAEASSTEVFVPAPPVNDPAQDGPMSSGSNVTSRTQPPEPGVKSPRPAFSPPPRIETQPRPASSASVGRALYNTGEKDTQTVPSTPAATNNQAISQPSSTNTTRGTTAASNGGASPARHVYPAPSQFSAPNMRSPNVTPASHANAANVRAPPVAVATAAYNSSPRAQGSDSSFAYPHFLPRGNSPFDSNKTLQPAPDVVLDPTTPAGRKALREKFKAAATPQVPKDKYDVTAAGSMGIGFASSATDLAPKSDPPPKPTRPLTHAETQRRLAAVAGTINNSWSRRY